jgi:hypothetical protein
MKYRIVTDKHAGFKVEHKWMGIWWTQSRHGPDGDATYDTIEKADEVMQALIRRRLVVLDKKRNSGRVIKTAEITPEDVLAWKLKGKV